MKKIITITSILLAAFANTNAQTTATNWTAQDCNSNNHTLFTDLNAGKVVVMVWVMPCGSCVNGATAAFNAAQSFATAYPGKVVYYLSDDLGDATCTDLNSWITTNSIGDISKMSVFSNVGNTIKESDLGGSGMPHVAVIGGGAQHKVYFNKMNSATNDQAGITTAIASAIAGTSVQNVTTQIQFSISPNPAKETMTVTYANRIKKITVLSITGQVIKEETYAEAKMNPVFNLSGMVNGVYSVKVTDVTGQTGVQKIVKE
jgi:hypothetical protein